MPPPAVDTGRTLGLLSPPLMQFEGSLVAPDGSRFAIVASRFNETVVRRLVEGAQEALIRHGAHADRVDVAWAPGAFELPLVASRLAGTGHYDAVICLGAVIRGATAHFEYVAGPVANGCSRVMLDTGVPVLFGVLTVDTLDQAWERAGTKAGNKGAEAASGAIEMISLLRSIDASEGQPA